jgi:hypothetical protein
MGCSLDINFGNVTPATEMDGDRLSLAFALTHKFPGLLLE